MTRIDEIEAKLSRVRDFLRVHGLAAAAFGTQANFAWITAGGDNHVGLAAEGGVATVVVTRFGRHVVTSTIEAPRLADEELAGLGFELHVHRWHREGPERLVSVLAGGGTLAADGALAGAENLAGPLARLRWQLLPPEIERYRAAGRECAGILERLARQVEPGMTEFEIAGRMEQQVFASGLLPNVCLVATDERAARYRHPIPTRKPLERYAMLVIGARRGGLCVSATRCVHFGPVPADLQRRHEAACAVDACLILGSEPGAQVDELFTLACREYERQGFPGEWENHHQGGATGYAPREYRASAQLAETILADQAFAWNPSVAGAKSEDTILATRDRPVVLSAGDDWPALPVTYADRSIGRPAILQR
jgi:antitoxin VapB